MSSWIAIAYEINTIKQDQCTRSWNSLVCLFMDANVVSRYKQFNCESPDMYWDNMGDFERFWTHHRSATHPVRRIQKNHQPRISPVYNTDTPSLSNKNLRISSSLKRIYIVPPGQWLAFPISDFVEWDLHQTASLGLLGHPRESMSAYWEAKPSVDKSTPFYVYTSNSFLYWRFA